ncbi:NTP transferase domain-containing protein [Microbacterium sp. MEC084]|uniref:nucleotidyltransferase family protein n=1 Tax=Microbacterium sp. MEC084 TaxID=1963027 RepID=UPI00197C5ECE|nr:NTP transferase domain-containing protein [Microbacterium sp. MEC084]
MDPARVRLCGLVLAAGAGRRFGGPKALARGADGAPWVARAVDALVKGGCDRVVVALSPASAAAAALVPAPATSVVVGDAARGLAATLRGALAAAVPADGVVILPVDTPDVVPGAVRRVIAEGGRPLRQALAQAVYRGRPGHPVLVGADHVAALRATLRGDEGARAYLRAAAARQVECGDLWSGDDIDERGGAHLGS